MRIQPGWRAALLRGAVLGTGLLGFAGNAAATPIDDKYAETGGGSGRLGMPTAAEAAAPDGVGKFRQFARGVIYWHPKIGAHMVIGLILARWSELGAEKGYLGYPMTDEIGTFDGSGRVSKFQGGELIWHSATNKVTEVRSTDLVVDLPFPPGEPWFVIQANAVTNSDSHRGPWAYCWDFDLAGKPQAASNGALFTAATDGPILHVDQKNKSVGLAGETNVIVERLGAGRYASYLHLRPDSYTRHFGASAGGAVPQGMPSGRWPVAKSGVVLAEVGEVGAGIGAFHLHFCITTRPDRPHMRRSSRCRSRSAITASRRMTDATGPMSRSACRGKGSGCAARQGPARPPPRSTRRQRPSPTARCWAKSRPLPRCPARAARAYQSSPSPSSAPGARCSQAAPSSCREITPPAPGHLNW
jgi:hypothetical protein